jgi:hypothetical protein
MNDWLNTIPESGHPADWGLDLSYGDIGDLRPVAIV